MEEKLSEGGKTGFVRSLLAAGGRAELHSGSGFRGGRQERGAGLCGVREVPAVGEVSVNASGLERTHPRPFSVSGEGQLWGVSEVLAGTTRKFLGPPLRFLRQAF